jgi:hypothetical protein
MRLVTVLVVLLTLLSANAAFAGDLRAAAHAAALQPDPTASRRGAMPPGLKWSGIGLLIGGGVTVLLGAAVKNDDSCGVSIASDDCEAIGTGFYVLGAALAGTGAVLLGLANAKREHLPTISVQRGRFAIRQRFTF